MENTINEPMGISLSAPREPIEPLFDPTTVKPVSELPPPEFPMKIKDVTPKETTIKGELGTTSILPEPTRITPPTTIDLDGAMKSLPPVSKGTGINGEFQVEALQQQADLVYKAKESYTKESLMRDEHWNSAAMVLANKFIPNEVATMTQEQVAEWGIEKIRGFENNVGIALSMGFDFDEASAEEKGAMAFMLEAFDNKEWTGQGFLDALGYNLVDPINFFSFATLGAGMAAKVGIKKGVEMTLKQKLMHGAILGTVEGVPAGVAESYARQYAGTKIGTQDEISHADAAIMGAFGAVAGATLGAGMAGGGHYIAKGYRGAMDWAEGGMAQAAGGGMPNKHQIAADYDDALASLPTITLGDLEGKTIVPIIADLTKAGTNYTGIDSSKTSPVALMGGPNYPFLQSSMDGGVVWANKGSQVDSALLKHADEDGFVYGVVTNMLNDSHQSNTSVVHATMETIKAYERDGRLTADNVLKIKSSLDKHADSMISKANKAIASGEKALNKAKTKKDIDEARESIKKGKSILNRGDELKNVPDFKDVDNALEYIDNMTFDGRKLLMERMSMNEIGSIKGMPNIGKILDATREAEYSGGQWGDGQVVIKMQVGDAVKLGENGTIEHPSYSHGIKGEVVGKLGRPLPNQTLFPEFFKDRRAYGSDEAGDKRAFSMSQPGQKVTADMIAENPTSPLGNIKSPRQARMVKDFADDNWKTSEGTGGVSSADYSKALRQSTASSTLSQYTHQKLTSAAKKGSTHYQLGDSQAFFSLSKNTDYSYLNNKKPIPGLTGKETSLNSVINNEQHAPGMGDALIAKAIQQGAEVLDCFNVKTTDKPGGILPSYYAKHDFEIVHSAPFDKSFYKDPKALDDIMETWKQQGWDPEDGYPDVVVMKYTGDENARARATSDVLNGGTEVSPRGSAGLNTTGVQGPIEDGGKPVSGDKLGAGSVDAVRGEESRGGRASNVSRVYDELSSLSDQELVNLHINERAPITMAMEEKLERVNKKLAKTTNKKARKDLLDRIQEIVSEEE